MNKKIRAIGAGALVGVWLTLTAFAWFGQPQEQSEAERRKLAQMPEITVESLLDTTETGFAKKFEILLFHIFPPAAHASKKTTKTGNCAQADFCLILLQRLSQVSCDNCTHERLLYAFLTFV